MYQQRPRVKGKSYGSRFSCGLVLLSSSYWLTSKMEQLNATTQRYALPLMRIALNSVPVDIRLPVIVLPIEPVVPQSINPPETLTLHIARKRTTVKSPVA